MENVIPIKPKSKSEFQHPHDDDSRERAEYITSTFWDALIEAHRAKQEGRYADEARFEEIAILIEEAYPRQLEIKLGKP